MAGAARERRRLVRCSLLACAVVSACSPTRPAIAFNEGIVIIQNQTRHEWRKVIVTVNDHFRAGAPSLAAGGRMTAPLSQFQTAFGQRFDRSTQSVARIDLTATDADGRPVTLAWTGNTDAK